MKSRDAKTNLADVGRMINRNSPSFKFDVSAPTPETAHKESNVFYKQSERYARRLLELR